MTFDIDKLRIGVIGLGYVGLPLAVEFGRRFPTVGFDINEARIAELEAGQDSTLEVTPEELADVNQLSYTSDISILSDCNFYIVTVPTPISRSKRPVLTPLRLASERRHRRIRVDRLSGGDRGILRALPGTGLGPEAQQGFLRWL
jgi:UDP-N-acetyl-D-galactosamine dehydrogenase